MREIVDVIIYVLRDGGRRALAGASFACLPWQPFDAERYLVDFYASHS